MCRVNSAKESILCALLALLAGLSFDTVGVEFVNFRFGVEFVNFRLGQCRLTIKFWNTEKCPFCVLYLLCFLHCGCGALELRCG